jgi:Na+-driven multidrug efflux pump
MTQTTKEKIKKTADLFIGPVFWTYAIVAAVLLIGYNENSIQFKIGLIMTVGVALMVAAILLFLLIIVCIGYSIENFIKFVKKIQAIWKA